MQINLNLENPFDKARQAFKKEAPPAQSYAEHKANFEKSALGQEVTKAFTPLPYEKENKGLYLTAGFVSYACQVVSIGAAASFVFVSFYCAKKLLNSLGLFSCKVFLRIFGGGLCLCWY